MDDKSRKCHPLLSLQQLEQWSANQVNYKTEPLVEHHFYDGRRIIVCHDMKGGYLEDSYIDGCSNLKAYRFFQWSLIDAFIYFSHYLVTIPPVTWINAAHKNGVPVLGTFITEGEEGKIVCLEIFKSKENCLKIAHKLASVANGYKFEGWLINIENEISMEYIPHVIMFLRCLTKEMKSIHSNSLVIWYDSVTKQGQLKWQNALNDKNVQFFQSCDAIYLNYIWTDEHLNQSLKFSDNRKFDVYAGVDIFGRDCWGGGGFNTSLAIEKISAFNLSIALFAPGWVHEVGGEDNFENNQIKFWKSLNLPIRHVPKLLPFKTNFCQGFGHSLFKDGKSVSNNPWFNLNKFEPQPRCYFDFEEINTSEAFEGGICLRIKNFHEPIVRGHFQLQPSQKILIKLIVKYDACDFKTNKFALMLNLITSTTHCKPCHLVQEYGRINLQNSWIAIFFEFVPNCLSTLSAVSIVCSQQNEDSAIYLGMLEITN